MVGVSVAKPSSTDADLAAQPRNSRGFRILALSGGGFLGLYSAAVLAGIEADIGEPIGRRFDLIAGTSVGGIIASAAAFELPMDDVVELFLTRGAAIFSPRGKPGGTIGRLIDLSRSVLGPKYGNVALRAALAERFGKARMKDALHPLLLPAVNVTRSRTKVFKTPHSDTAGGDENVALIDAVLAACAAPAYFPSVKIGNDVYADGGLFAVAPDQVALHEAEHFLAADPAVVRMLSLGTAIRSYRPAAGVDTNAGALGWLSDGRLILTMIAVQQQHVQAMMEDRLGDRYLRLDADWPGDAGLGIDVATSQAAAALQALAEKTLQATERRLLKRFL